MISASDRAMLTEIAANAPHMVERAIGWCAINSGSRNLAGLDEMSALLETELARLPGTVERKPLAPATQIAQDGSARSEANGAALLLTVRPQAQVQVVLTGHYDTVYPADTAFRTVQTRADGALHGPGIADMKGGISVLLGALAAFERHPDAARIGYRVLLSPDEETGSLSSAPLLAQIALAAHLGLTYEPALEDGTLAGARKGSGNFHLVVHGRSAHAGRDFASGRNAIAAAAAIAAQLAALNGLREGLTLNVARIDGGAALNTVPDHAVVRFNVRYSDPRDKGWTDEQLAAILKAQQDGITLQLHGGFHRPAKPFNRAQTALFEALKETGALLGQSIAWKDSGGVCEGNNLFASGVPNIDTLGVRGGDIHSEREFAWPDSFAERAKLSALILARIARGDIDARAIHAAMKD
jgi:glutamate carboxypeptidase